MEILKKHVILYDADCPLCNVYTKGFIKYKLLDKDGRIPYHEFDFKHNAHIDQDLACDKIVLLNTETNEITYGLDSLIKIIKHNFPFLANILKIKFIYYLLSKLYSFISYNRKMIAPSDIRKINSCNPSLNKWSRIIFIILCAMLVHVIVTWYFKSFLYPHLSYNFNLPDIALFVAQLIFQALFFYFLKQKNIFDYLGQISFVSVLGALGLLFFGLGLKILQVWNININLLADVCYGGVIMWMFLEHLRRVQLYNWSNWLCLSWVVFRILIYPFVFKF